MAALLIRRRRPIGELAGTAATLDGIRGAGRIVAARAELGVELGVNRGGDLDDSLGSVHQLVVDPEWPPDDIDGLDLGREFGLVVLGSHMVNRPEEPIRLVLLGLARRHLAADGRLLIEHHPIDWAQTASEIRATPGGAPGMVDVRRDPPFVSAISVYDARGRVESQPFTARVLSEDELAAACAAAGLTVRGRLGPTWLRASSAASTAASPGA
jgi:hypothetical protein